MKVPASCSLLPFFGNLKSVNLGVVLSGCPFAGFVSGLSWKVAANVLLALFEPTCNARLKPRSSATLLYFPFLLIYTSQLFACPLWGVVPTPLVPGVGLGVPNGRLGPGVGEGLGDVVLGDGEGKKLGDGLADDGLGEVKPGLGDPTGDGPCDGIRDGLGATLGEVGLNKDRLPVVLGDGPCDGLRDGLVAKGDMPVVVVLGLVVRGRLPNLENLAAVVAKGDATVPPGITARLVGVLRLLGIISNCLDNSSLKIVCL